MPNGTAFLTSDGRPLSYGSAVAWRRNFGLGPRMLLSVVKATPRPTPRTTKTIAGRYARITSRFVAPCAVLLLSAKAHLKSALRPRGQERDDEGGRRHHSELAPQDRRHERQLVVPRELRDVGAAL